MKLRQNYYEMITKNSQRLSLVPLSEPVDEDKIEYPCYLYLDQATNTGFAVVDDYKRLVTSGVFSKEDHDSLQDFKFGLKDYLLELVFKYKVKIVWYEETYHEANHWTTEVLTYIKSMIKDLEYEVSNGRVDMKAVSGGMYYDQYLSMVASGGTLFKVMGVDHTRWKSMLAKPATFKKGSDDKKEVRKHVKAIYPLFELIQDEMDAIGMSIALTIKNGDKPVHFNARINKTLPVELSVFVLKDGETVEDRVASMKKRFRDVYASDGAYRVDYHTSMDTHLNARYALSFRDGVMWSEIPMHKNLGIIYLHNGIVPKSIEEGDRVVMVAVKKK